MTLICSPSPRIALDRCGLDDPGAVHPPHRINLSDMAGHLTFTARKAKGSAAGVGLSARMVAAFEQQRRRQAVERTEWAACYGR
jgi:hypothetical protein